MLQDLRFTFRLLLKERWFSAAAIVALALGIGVNAVGFTLVHAAFLRGLPFDGADQLFVLTWQSRAGRRNVSHAEFRDWREQNRSFEGLAAYRSDSMNVSDSRALPEQARGTRMTANSFELLKQAPLLGRGFTNGDDQIGAEPVAVISYTFWKNRYGADPDVIGTPIRVDGQPATVVGVMPEGMRFPDNTEVWLPAIPAVGEARDRRSLNVFGRLKSNLARLEAQTEMNGIAERLTAAFPDINKGFIGIRVQTFTERYVGGAGRTMLLVIMGAVSFVLLIACANVANLLLSRSANRAREVAVRAALGATRWRVVRQLLVESLALAFIGGSLGLLLANFGVQTFDAAVTDPGKPYWMDFRVDYVVFGYVAGICSLTAILFGLAPALHVSKTNNNEVLKEGGRGTTGNRRARWLSGTMVVTELALTVVLLAGAGLMLRSFMNLERLDAGFSIEHLLTMRLQLPEAKYGNADERRAFYEQLEPRLAAIAGVDAVAVTTTVPPLRAGERVFEIDGRPPAQAPAQNNAELEVAAVTISPRFFEVVGVNLLRGRSFADADGAAGSETVIINERMASQYFPGEDPLGRRIRFVPRQPTPDQPISPWRTIVGVSPSIRHGETRQVELNAVVYIPQRQEPPAGAALLVRSRLPPGALVDPLRRAVQSVDADQPVFSIQTLDRMLDEERWPFRVFGVMFAAFAIIALVLSSVGLYAVMAYSVTQRTSEIGLRMALGAQGRQVEWMILRLGLIQLAVGLSLGLAGALLVGSVMDSMLVGITPGDPTTLAAIATLLTTVSLAACLLPARRATKVDPLTALRAE